MECRRPSFLVACKLVHIQAAGRHSAVLASVPITSTTTYYFRHVAVVFGFIDIGILRRRRDFALWIYDKAVARAERETSRPDFYSHILANNGTKEKDGRVMSI